MRRGVLITAVLWVSAGATAHAGTVSYSQGSLYTGLCSKYDMCGTKATLTMTAAPGEVNVISPGPPAQGALTIHDAGAPLSVAPGASNCSNLDPNTVRCTLILIPTGGDLRMSMVANLGDGDDSVGDTTDPGADLSVDGGPGNDRLSGGGALKGGSGDDTLTGGYLDGGPGNDVLTSTSGGGNLDGGDGNDVITSTATGASFANARGGAGDDRISVAGDRATLSGNDGRDELIATGNNSHLDGGGGADHLVGGPRGDTLYGGDGNDDLEGGGGNDTLVGSGGIDHLDGGTGADKIFARDQRRDTIDCGDGATDRATIDVGDRVSRCETVSRPVTRRRR
jgi:Ca2+-binding RTX toxin-like protein